MTIYTIKGTYEQFCEFYIWAENNNPDILRNFVMRFKARNGSSGTIAIFPEYIKDWLIEYCDLEFVLEQLKG